METFHSVPLVDLDGTGKLNVDACIVGVPSDRGGVTGYSGAKYAPSAIRTVSHLRGRLFNMSTGEYFLDGRAPIVDAGDLNVAADSTRDLCGVIAAQISRLVARNIGTVVALGGDHSVTLGILEGLRERYGPLQLIYLDAHADTWFGVEDCITHAEVVYRALRSGLVSGGWIVGLRGYGPNDSHSRWCADRGVTWITMDDIVKRGWRKVLSEIRGALRHPAYLSVDIDVVDPAYAPGTGSPEPGGLTAAEILCVIRRLAASGRLVGSDVVEVCPSQDQSNITALLAHRIVLELTCAASRSA